MRGRSAALALAGVLVLAGLVALRCSMSTDAPPPPPTPAPPRAAARTPVPPPVETPAPVAPPPVVHAPVTPHGPAAPAAQAAPALPPVLAAMVPAKKKAAIANKALLRVQVAAVAPQLAACAEQAGFAGSGSAVLTYLVEPDPKKQIVAIETTGVEYDGTTIDDQPLLDCLKDTAKAMTFKYVPDTDGVFAFRRVRFDRGKLVENKFLDFHYVR